MEDQPRSPLASITFAEGTRDRADHLRGDRAALDALLAAPEARILPLWRGKPLMRREGEATLLEWLAPGAEALAVHEEGPIFLGLEGAAGRFALDVSAWDGPEASEAMEPGIPGFADRSRQSHESLPEGAGFTDLRSAMARLGPQDAADAATARGMMEWHRTHRFCSRCGAASSPDSAGWRRVCGACGAQHFPRTDPVVIQLITRGDRVLLGRQPSWGKGFWSLLAGFVEPGESLEAAVRRETMEEAGVPVGAVRYLACQPWPFPNSLMFGMAGEALADEITIDPNELEDARWFTRDEVRAGLAGTNPELIPGRAGAIAHSVILAWAEGWAEG